MDNFNVAIVGGTGNLGSALALRLGAPGVKIIIDTVVPLNKVKPFVPAAGSALQEAQQILGDEAPVIGALHNISAVDLGDVDSPLGDVLVCGDNAEAKQKVMEIIERIGATAYDAGPAS